MSEISINTGYEFLFSKLHGWWGRSAHGERLRTLTACVTKENLLQTLKGMAFEMPAEENFEKGLRIREFAMLRDFIALADAASAQFLRALLISIKEENLKVILNCRFFPEGAPVVAEMLLSLPGEEPLTVEKLLQTPTVESFIELLPEEFSSPALAEVIRKLAEDRDFMAAECAIDALDFQRQLECAGALPLRVRRQGRQQVGWEIDITNIVMLLRNLNMYHFPPQRLETLWLPGGCHLKHEQLATLGQAANVEEAIRGLPEPFLTLLLPAYSNQELYHCEHQLWNFLARQARLLFRDFNNPQSSILAFPYLLRFETINLARIYEGIRFGLPVKSIQSMMIGEL